ncbi:septum formation initiator family protein [Patescibacteria group bacterium]|nr:septum formation initiator family protein [Patescibacteria group bacterium]MBU1034402.1 septum formation initiator family protein [Patescibacteria group bacterium]MBU1629461.1 septum formation initiator family protein [Patescibacteria group bacterium]MBU1908007.1 septum formation initiator family protein [Patescibacteria group bacterium]
MLKTGADKKPSLKTLVKWPVFLLANAALLLVIGVSTVRETYRGWTVDREIHALEAQAKALEGKKLQLESLTAELLSPDRVELEARARLGLKKPEERVIILQGFSTTASWTGDVFGQSAGEVVQEPDSRSNPKRWLDYFFGKS